MVQANQKLNSHERIAQSEFIFFVIFIFLPQTLFHKNIHSVHSVLTKHYFTKIFTVCTLYLPNIISQKLLQCALCTYQTLFHKNFYSVCSVLTKHYFTKTFTVCALYLPNIISQKHSQCVLCTYQTLFHKDIILNKNFFIRESWLSSQVLWVHLWTDG